MTSLFTIGRVEVDKILQAVDLMVQVAEENMMRTQQDFQEVVNGKNSTSINKTK